jgi:V/A-type H+-transporting ATPase subunit I
MTSAEHRFPVDMSRIALVAPTARLRPMLVAVARAGTVQLVGPLPPPQGRAVEALRRLERTRPGGAREAPLLSAEEPDVERLEREGRLDLLAGEVDMRRRAEAAARRDGFSVLVGWAPSAEVEALGERLAGVGAAAVVLPRPRHVEPPTLLRPREVVARFRPLVSTYGATRYADIDPTPFAAASFVLMFGMMFGDVGHGLLLVALGLLLRRSRARRLQGLRPLWPFAVAGGAAAAIFGLLYGEAFGPTGLVPALWMEPLDDPVRLLAVAVGVGALLLAVSYGIGVRNRWRESGARVALLAPSGVAGLALFAGGGVLALGLYAGLGWVTVLGAVLGAAGLALLFAGFVAEAGLSGAGGAQAVVEVLDAVVRVGANVVSFARLAAFGLMHAALGSVVLDGSRFLWHRGAMAAIAGAALFAVGNALAFALEALVAGVQAMRLEYYELFSRVFAGEGEPFAPWRLPVEDRGRPA